MVNVLDFSPKHENTENVKMELFQFKSGADFERIVYKLRKKGFAFPGDKYKLVDYFFVRKTASKCHYIKADFNSLTGRKELSVTCKSWLKSYPQYKGINIDKLVKDIY